MRGVCLVTGCRARCLRPTVVVNRIYCLFLWWQPFRLTEGDLWYVWNWATCKVRGKLVESYWGLLLPMLNHTFLFSTAALSMQVLGSSVATLAAAGVKHQHVCASGAGLPAGWLKRWFLSVPWWDMAGCSWNLKAEESSVACTAEHPQSCAEPAFPSSSWLAKYGKGVLKLLGWPLVLLKVWLGVLGSNSV